MQRTDEIAATVRAFFATARGASLELPDGWFGRPYDNLHSPRVVDVVGDDVIIGIDELQTLTLHRPSVAEVHGRVLTLSGFGNAAWDWTEYGSDPPKRHHRDVPPGPVRFHA